MRVGRSRRTDRHLPRRMYAKHGAFWFVDRSNRWHRLGTDYAEALRRYAALQERPAASHLDALITRYEDEILPQRAAATRASRRQEFKRIRRVFGCVLPADISAADAWAYYTEAGQSPQARHELAALSAVLGWAVKWGVLERNPMIGLRLPGHAPRSRYVTDAEFLAVRSLANPMVRAAMDIALITGLRQRDVLNLERRQVSDQALTVTTAKTGKAQAFPMTPTLDETIKAALRERPQVRRVVIANRSGRPYTTDGFQAIWQRLQRKALKRGAICERFTFHDLRAKSISDAATLEEGRARAGHADARITAAVYRRLPEPAPVLDITKLRGK